MNRPERSQTEILAENLSEIMHRKSISQNALARKLDVSPTVVNKWCRGISIQKYVGRAAILVLVRQVHAEAHSG